jgi:hypothetical protein
MYYGVDIAGEVYGLNFPNSLGRITGNALKLTI